MSCSNGAERLYLFSCLLILNKLNVEKHTVTELRTDPSVTVIETTKRAMKIAVVSVTNPLLGLILKSWQ